MMNGANPFEKGKEYENLGRAYHCTLVGADFERASLAGYDLRRANFTNANFRGADLSHIDLRGATLIKCDFSRANLHGADLSGADLSGSDLSMSYGKAALMVGARVWRCAFRQAIWKNAFFIDTDLSGSDFVGAQLMGARFNGANLSHVRNLDRAIFYWWLNPHGGPPSYDPRPGWNKLDSSILGGISIQENASMNRR